MFIEEKCPELGIGISPIPSHSESDLPHESYNNNHFHCLVRALAVVTLGPLVIGAPIPEKGDFIQGRNESILPALIQSDILGTVQRAALASKSPDLLLRMLLVELNDSVALFGACKAMELRLSDAGGTGWANLSLRGRDSCHRLFNNV